MVRTVAVFLHFVFPSLVKIKYFYLPFYNFSDTDLLMTHIKNESKEGIEVSISYKVTLSKLLFF